MNKKRKNRFSTVVFYTLFIMMILLVVSSYLTSGLVAKYTSTDSATDLARVAKWDINYVDSEGTELRNVMMSEHLEAGSNDSWGLDIINNSEVAAKFTNTSRVTLRLYSTHFDPEHNHDTWNFLHDAEGEITNPINFQVYLYNCSYIEATGANKENYQSKLIFDTATSDLTFELVVEDGYIYYETIVDFSSLNLDSSFDLAASTGTACILVNWSVNGISAHETDNETFTSYHLVKKEDYDVTKYNGIIDTNKNEIEVTADNLSVLDSNLHDGYVIAYKKHDYFGYYIFTSVFDGDYKATTNETLESLQLPEYNRFMEIKNSYDASSEYLNLGIECRILFNLKVEQVD